MKVEDVDWKDLSIKVTGKAGKERYVGIGHKTAQAIERYLRRRHSDNPYLWVTTGNCGRFTINGLRMMLERHFRDAGVEFRGAHAFRRVYAMSYLAAGGQENAPTQWARQQFVG